MRLVDGDQINAGRVEVRISGVWGTVCADSFHEFEAIVLVKVVLVVLVCDEFVAIVLVVVLLVVLLSTGSVAIVLVVVVLVVLVFAGL